MHGKLVGRSAPRSCGTAGVSTRCARPPLRYGPSGDTPPAPRLGWQLWALRPGLDACVPTVHNVPGTRRATELRTPHRTGTAGSGLGSGTAGSPAGGAGCAVSLCRRRVDVLTEPTRGPFSRGRRGPFFSCHFHDGRWHQSLPRVLRPAAPFRCEPRRGRVRARAHVLDRRAVDVRALAGLAVGLDDTPPYARLGGGTVTVARGPRSRMGVEVLLADLFGPYAVIEKRAALFTAIWGVRFRARPAREPIPGRRSRLDAAPTAHSQPRALLRSVAP